MINARKTTHPQTLGDTRTNGACEEGFASANANTGLPIHLCGIGPSGFANSCAAVTAEERGGLVAQCMCAFGFYYVLVL